MSNKQVIYIKYSELTLKGKNRMDFVRILAQNVKHALKQIPYKLTYYYDYLVLEDFSSENVNEIIEILKVIPGINSFSLAYLIEKDLQKLSTLVLDVTNNLLKEQVLNKFRITCSRTDKTFSSSPEIIDILATTLLNNTNLKVGLKDYDLNLQIEVKKDYIVVFYKSIKGANGLPIRSSGNCLMLLSGGIDSPVASRLLMQRGLYVNFLTFITPPHTSEQALQKVRDLVKLITVNNKLCQAKLFICNFSNLQHELTHIKKESYRITLMRRCFFRIAKKIAIKNNFKAIATGESLGQVASQTIESMQVISDVLDDFLILRPLVSFDKEEIIKLANKYNTYETSILPYDDSCSLFAPKNPVTKPTIKIAKELEESCFLLDDLIEKTIEKDVHMEELIDNEFRKIY